MDKVNLDDYTNFVKSVTSKESNFTNELIGRISDLDAQTNIMDIKINTSLLLTSGIGISSEGGEFNEIIKKIIFQGKPLNEESRFHMKRELGDIIFYWINACRALGYTPDEVISENIHKLEARYPNGFSVFKSENRKIDDL